MKVLTIKQPWATLIMQGDKRFEVGKLNIGESCLYMLVKELIKKR